MEGAILDLTGPEPVFVAATQQAEIVTKPELSDSDLVDIIKGWSKHCARCNRDVYTMRVWGDGTVCGECYNVVYPLHRDALEAWVREAGPKECAFCGKVRGNPSDFHYDHVNMFKKTGTVGRMLFDGVALERIKEEIRKCQLLCIDCHAIVTKMEHHLGFVYVKKYKQQRDNGYNRGDYDVIMSRVYGIIKRIKNGGA